MQRTPLATLLVLLAALPLVACRGAEVEAPAQGDLLARAQDLEIANARAPLPGVLTAGRLLPEQMTALAEAGYGTFVDLRGTEEKGTGWETEHAAALGVRYVSIPMTSADDVSEENAHRLCPELDTATGPVVVYCASGNRAGALLAMHAWNFHGASPEEALELGLDAGLTRLGPVVREKLGL